MDRLNEVKPRSLDIFSTHYEKIYTLGKGNFGKVYLAEDRKCGKQYAVKVVDKTKFKSGEQKQHAQREQIICEAFAKGLKHKNIVDVYDVMTEDGATHIVMEYIEGGELFDKIKQSKGLAEPTARRWFKEIIEAVEYIHDNNIVHRDLKPENVLIDKTQHIKLCDFGFGNMVQEQHQVLSTYCGSPFYASPEMVTATPYTGPPVDLWSCGVILYAMLTGSLPFQSDEMPRLFQKISKGAFVIPVTVSKDAADLIRRLLCKDPKNRITAKECLTHPWLSPPAPPSVAQSGISHSSIMVSSELTLTSKMTVSSNMKKKLLNRLSDGSLHSTLRESAEWHPQNHKQLEYKKISLFTRLFAKKTRVGPCETKIDQEKLLAKKLGMLNQFKGFVHALFSKEARLNGA